MTSLSRRAFMAAIAASTLGAPLAHAQTPMEIDWEDLIPPGVPYAEIIGEGVVDESIDFWNPVYDSNASKLNPALDQAHIKIPGYILPLDETATGVTTFILVPYVGACLHTPPPPANQLIYVTTETPWPAKDMWDAVWVTGRLQHGPYDHEMAEIGYILTADHMELYDW